MWLVVWVMRYFIFRAFLPHLSFLSVTYVYKHYYSAAIAVETILWHMQENLAPHRWWKLGKSLEEYMFRLFVLLDILGTDMPRHFLPGLLRWMPYLGSCWMWLDMQQHGGYFLTLFSMLIFLMPLMLDMQLFYWYPLLTRHYAIGFRKYWLFLSGLQIKTQNSCSNWKNEYFQQFRVSCYCSLTYGCNATWINKDANV